MFFIEAMSVVASGQMATSYLAWRLSNPFRHHQLESRYVVQTTFRSPKNLVINILAVDPHDALLYHSRYCTYVFDAHFTPDALSCHNTQPFLGYIDVPVQQEPTLCS